MGEVTIKARAKGRTGSTGPCASSTRTGNEFVLPEGEAIVLCRCGHSANKPFCDKSHRRHGFVADDAAPRVSS